MEDNPIWSKWSHYRHVPSKENSTTIDAKICQLGTDTRWHFGKCPLSNHNLQSDPLDMRPVKATVFIKTPFRTNWHNFWDGKSNTTVLTHELLDAQDLRLVSIFIWSEPSGRVRTDLAVLSSTNWSFLKFDQNIAGKQNDMFGIQIFICYENAHLGQSKYSDGKLRTVAHQLGLWRLIVRSLPGGIRFSRPKLRFPKTV